MANQLILLVLIIGWSCGHSSSPSRLPQLQRMQHQESGSDNCSRPPLYCVDSRYRTYDGSCNNMEEPSWGVPYTEYLRSLNRRYADHVYEFPRAASGNELPSARKISILLHPERHVVDPTWNLNAMQWGQIIAHDMSLIEDFKQLSECCDDYQIPSNKSDNPHCGPIIIPEDDPFHGPLGHTCLPFMRSGTTWDHGCFDPNELPQQISMVTAYMDLSLVYGGKEEDARNLRNNYVGRLWTTLRNDEEFPPRNPDVKSACPFARSQFDPCYLTGDIRTNQNPQLALLQIILLREHNRLASHLNNLNPHWDDETIYQEARRINIATYQHINYYEYLPILLGREHMIENELIHPNVQGYVNDYNPKINPSVTLEHASAAFRHFHTQISGYLQLALENRTVHDWIRLSDWFFRPRVLELGNGFSDLARGFTTQAQDFSDPFFSHEITQYLFRGNNSFGNDLRAIDIQRGRDHGLGNYIAARKDCQLSVPETFDDMEDDIIDSQDVEILKTLYESPEDVDLIVGGTLEIKASGAQVGPTFLCILTRQFYRTRVGDRYFYENGADTKTAFTPSQLQSIRQGASIARLLCDNIDDIKQMQPQAFGIIRDRNHLVWCFDLPAVDLTLWQEIPTAT